MASQYLIHGHPWAADGFCAELSDLRREGKPSLRSTMAKLQNVRNVSLRLSSMSYISIMGTSSLFAVIMLLARSFALPPPFFPSKSGPICFTPPDLHPVSDVTETCSTLLSDFVKSYKPEGSILRWTSNPSEIGEDVVHLPKIEYLVDHNRTQACLLEILDTTGAGDSFPATEIKDSGKVILDECFRFNKCGLIPLPPLYTTSLAVCGSRHKANHTVHRVSEPALGYAVNMRSEAKRDLGIRD